jgi:hypothetical protein
VIDAVEAIGAPASLHHDQRAAVRAAVLERVQPALRVARHHHRHVADGGGEEAAGIGQLGLEAEEAPGRAAPDALELLAVHVGILVDPVRDARRAFGGPASLEHRSL